MIAKYLSREKREISELAELSMTFPFWRGCESSNLDQIRSVLGTVSCSPSILLDGRVGHLARQANSPDGGLKIPAVCPNGYGNHPLNVLFSLIGDALFANFKNLLFIDRLTVMEYRVYLLSSVRARISSIPSSDSCESIALMPAPTKIGICMPISDDTLTP